MRSTRGISGRCRLRGSRRRPFVDIGFDRWPLQRRRAHRGIGRALRQRRSCSCVQPRDGSGLLSRRDRERCTPAARNLKAYRHWRSHGDVGIACSHRRRKFMGADCSTVSDHRMRLRCGSARHPLLNAHGDRANQRSACPFCHGERHPSRRSCHGGMDDGSQTPRSRQLRARSRRRWKLRGGPHPEARCTRVSKAASWPRRSRYALTMRTERFQHPSRRSPRRERGLQQILGRCF